jgi:hypothetical protein
MKSERHSPIWENIHHVWVVQPLIVFISEFATKTIGPHVLLKLSL